jgi:hypothetical protein
MTKNDTIKGRSMHCAPASLTPYENNSRIHSNSQISGIADSITEFGFVKPVIVDENKMILAGHGAWLAAIDLEMPQIPIRQIEGLTHDQKKAYVIADNRLSELSKWDWELLTSELVDLQSADFDLAPVGFGDFGSEGNTHSRMGAKVTIGDGRFLLQIEFESEKEMESVYEELTNRGMKMKVLE